MYQYLNLDNSNSFYGRFDGWIVHEHHKGQEFSYFTAYHVDHDPGSEHAFQNLEKLKEFLAGLGVTGLDNQR